MSMEFPSEQLLKVSEPEEDLIRAAEDLSTYAYSQLQYYDTNVREAFKSHDRIAFDNSVSTALDNIISDVVSERITLESFGSNCTMSQFITLYKEMLENQEYKDKFTSELADKLYENLRRLDEFREYAYANGIPFSETPYDSNMDEFGSPYDYDGSMSIEDSRLAADANNLDEIMNQHSEELKSSAISFSEVDFTSRFIEQAEIILREYAAEHSTESWYKSMVDDPEYLKKVSNLVSPAMYNELRKDEHEMSKRENDAELSQLIEKLVLNNHSYTFSLVTIDSEDYVTGDYVNDADDLDSLGILDRFDEDFSHDNIVNAEISYYIIGQSENDSERLPDEFCEEIMAHLNTAIEYADQLEGRNIKVDFNEYGFDEENSEDECEM